MQAFDTLTSPAAPYLEANVNTDLIIRAERCVSARREDLGLYSFEAARYTEVRDPVSASTPNPDFVFNRAPFAQARIIVGGENFGCGSSREMAVWALMGMGIRCVIAPSFGEIFYNNCFQNGVLAIRLAASQVKALGALVAEHPTLTVDLPRQCIVARSGEVSIGFDCDPYLKRSLIEGRDAIAMTLANDAGIAAFQAADKLRRPWIYV